MINRKTYPVLPILDFTNEQRIKT